MQLMNHCRLLGTYLLSRLNHEAESLGHPFSDFHYEFATYFAAAKPKLLQNNPAVEDAAMLLVDSLELTPTVQAFESMVQQDVSTLKTQETATTSASELQQVLGSLRRHQALLSIFASLLEVMISSPSAPPEVKVASNGRRSVLDFMAEAARPQPFGAHVRFSGSERSSLLPPPGAPLQPGMTFNQPLPGEAGLQNPLAALAAAGLAHNAAYFSIQAGGPAGAPPDRTVSIYLNLGELRRTMIPFLWLSFKLSFFLYIFGRHAAPNKRIVLCILALICVLWETWSFRTRRALEFRRQAQQTFNRERAAANQEIDAANRGRPPHRQIPQVGPLPEGAVQPPSLFQLHINPRNLRQPPPLLQQPDAGPMMRLRQMRAQIHNPVPGAQALPAAQPTGSTSSSRRRSPWTASYWIARLAGVSLAVESRETGLRALLHRRDNCGLTPASVEKYTTIRDEQRWVRRLRTGIVLFFGSLIPDVERKRRRALEKRDRVLREIRAQCEKQEAELAEALIKFRETTGKQDVSEGTDLEDQVQESSDSEQPTDSRASSRDINKAGDLRTARVVHSLLENSRASTPDFQAVGEHREPARMPQEPLEHARHMGAEDVNVAAHHEGQLGENLAPFLQEEPGHLPLVAENEPPATMELNHQPQGAAVAGGLEPIPEAHNQMGDRLEAAAIPGDPRAADDELHPAVRDDAGGIDDDDDEERDGDNEVGM